MNTNKLLKVFFVSYCGGLFAWLQLFKLLITEYIIVNDVGF